MRCTLLAAADGLADRSEVGTGPGPSLTEKHTSPPSSAPAMGFLLPQSRGGMVRQLEKELRPPQPGTGAQRGKPKAERIPGLAERPASSDGVTAAV